MESRPSLDGRMDQETTKNVYIARPYWYSMDEPFGRV